MMIVIYFIKLYRIIDCEEDKNTKNKFVLENAEKI